MDGPPPTVEELLEEARAEETLAKLDVLEDLAELHETEQISVVRQTLARQYRHALGIFPEQRQEFRAGLQRIIDGDRQSVADVLEMLSLKN